MTRFIFPAAFLLAAACAPAVPPPAVPPTAVDPSATPAPPQAPAERVCTRIGCEDGWNVELIGVALPQTYTVRVLVEGRVVASMQCGPDNPCGETVFLPGVTAEEAELEIVGGEVPLRWTVRPEYNLLQPNGADCPPTCRQARVQIRAS
jgi:hypothetical protein